MMIELNKENFEKHFSENPVLIMDFWAEWCGPCKSFAPIFEAAAAKYPKIAFAKVNIEKEPELAQDFSVKSIPQLVIVKEKIVIYSEAGLLPSSALEDLIEKTVKLDLTEMKKRLDTEE